MTAQVLEWAGHPAEVILRLHIGRHRTVDIPITGNIELVGQTLLIPFKPALDTKVIGTLDDIEFEGLEG